MVINWGNIMYVVIGAVSVLIVRIIDIFTELKRIKLDEKKWQAEYFLVEKNKILRNLHRSIVELYYPTVSYALGGIKIKKIGEYNEYKSKFNNFKINKDLAKIYLSEVENDRFSKFFGALNGAQDNIFAKLPDDPEFLEYFGRNYIGNKERISTTDIGELNKRLRLNYEKALECLSDILNPNL